VNSNVKDDEIKIDLKRLIIENFPKSVNVTEHNRRNIYKMINSLKEFNLKKELTDRMKS
jgi:hypothetical protein